MFTRLVVRTMPALGLLIGLLVGVVTYPPRAVASLSVTSDSHSGPVVGEPATPTTGSTTPGGKPGDNAVTAVTAVTLTTEEKEIVRLVNVERVNAGLWPLAPSIPLTLAAREHNADMQAEEFFGHTGSDGSTPEVRAVRNGFATYGWDGAYVGENIAAGYATAQAVFSAWMESAGHRANILRPDYREIGVGYLKSPPGSVFSTYWTQDFGSEPKVLPVFVNDGAEQALTTVVKVTLTDETVSSWGSIAPVEEVMLSTDPGFTGASWRPYALNVWYTFPNGTGTRTVYVKLRDTAEQEVLSSDSFTLSPVELKYKVHMPVAVSQ